jgi:hypothetical protein
VRSITRIETTFRRNANDGRVTDARPASFFTPLDLLLCNTLTPPDDHSGGPIAIAASRREISRSRATAAPVAPSNDSSRPMVSSVNAA